MMDENKNMLDKIFIESKHETVKRVVEEAKFWPKNKSDIEIQSDIFGKLKYLLGDYYKFFEYNTELGKHVEIEEFIWDDLDWPRLIELAKEE